MVSTRPKAQSDPNTHPTPETLARIASYRVLMRRCGVSVPVQGREPAEVLAEVEAWVKKNAELGVVSDE